MKNRFLLPSFLILLTAFLLSSCGSNRSFSSRKYMAGNYLERRHKATKPGVNEQRAPELATLLPDTTSKTPSPVLNTATAAVDQPAIKAPAKEAVHEPGALASAMRSPGKVNQIQKPTTSQARVRSLLSARDQFLGKAERQAKADDDNGNRLDPVALTGFILGVLGLALNLIALAVIVATSEYVLGLLFIVGLVLGIMGVVFGSQGLRRHHKNNTGTLNLVFSIIGTAFGAGAIITAFVFAFYTLLLAVWAA